MSKRGVVILAVVALLGTWLFVVGYEFLEKENALFQKQVKAAKEDQQRCAARYAKYRNFDQFRTSIRLPYTSDLSLERWMRQFNTLHAGMSEQEVEIIMGAPDYAHCDVSDKGDKFVGSVWQYEVAVPQDAANDSQNSLIHVVFGPDGKLTDKSAVNMQPKPSPTPAEAQATPAPTGTATPGAAMNAGAPGASPQNTPSTASPAATPAQQAPVATPVPTQAAPSGAATPNPTPQ